jgi:catechol 2,3-dioxygenase-like lactoylglutathione lyase family enzyme
MTLQHVTIEVRDSDVGACVDFYRLLGFEPVEPPPSLGRSATWVERAGMQIHLLRTDEPVVPPRAHHAVVVDDYATTIEALRGAGFEPDPRREHWGSPRSFVRNPAGHRVEVMAFAPTAR